MQKRTSSSILRPAAADLPVLGVRGSTHGPTRVNWINGKFEFNLLSLIFLSPVEREKKDNFCVATSNKGNSVLYNKTTLLWVLKI